MIDVRSLNEMLDLWVGTQDITMQFGRFWGSMHEIHFVANVAGLEAFRPRTGVPRTFTPNSYLFWRRRFIPGKPRRFVFVHHWYHLHQLIPVFFPLGGHPAPLWPRQGNHVGSGRIYFFGCAPHHSLPSSPVAYHPLSSLGTSRSKAIC